MWNWYSLGLSADQGIVFHSDCLLSVAVLVSVVFGSCVVALVFVVVRNSIRKRTVNSSLVNDYMFR